MLCLNCSKETTNKKFCSRSCSASYNNQKFPKRQKEGKCKRCNQPTNSYRSYCDKCKPGNDITLGDAIYQKHHKSSAFALVRTRARTVLQLSNRNVCENCGYSKHVECAHRKPISHFHEDTLLSEINHEDNLLALCPNCHWEFDNNLLSI